MSIQSTKQLKVSDLIANLNTVSISLDDTLSNAQKSAERVEWFKLAITENRLTDFLSTIEETINSLPEGTNEVPTIHPVTGVKSTKKVNRRDIAKASYKTAFNHACKNTKFSDKVLTFKLSLPQLDDRKAPATFSDKLARMLKDEIDSKGLERIMQTIAKETKRHSDEVKALAENHKAMQLKATLLGDIGATMRKDGMTIEKAETIAAMMNDLTVDEMKAAIA